MAVTSHESSDGIREKAMRIVDELETGSSKARCSSPLEAENDRTGKANELVRSTWNLKYVDIVRSPGSVIRVFTSSERLAEDQRDGDEDREEWSENR